MKDEEIAKMHGITRENVRIRSRAKQKLIERLEGES
jgi:DNA-directed RNA polymerase specialized sigma24 family protein